MSGRTLGYMVDDQTYTYQIQAWYKKGATVFSVVHGTLKIVGDTISFVDDSKQLVFKFACSQIYRVRLDPSQFMFATSQGNYLVSLFDLKAYSFSRRPPLPNRIQGETYIEAGNDASIAIENYLKQHGVATYGIPTNVGSVNALRRGQLAVTLIAVILFLIIVVIVNH